MLTRQSKAIVVTPSPTRKERGDMAEYAALQGLPERDEAQAARLADLLRSLAVEQTRIIVSALNTLQYGRYEANRRAAAAWVTERSGQTWTLAVQGDEGLLLVESALRWARAHAAVTAVETRTASRVSDEAGDWQAVDWPELAGCASYVECVPGDLAGAIDELVFDLNPGLFRFAEQDATDAKKNGGISAD